MFFPQLVETYQVPQPQIRITPHEIATEIPKELVAIRACESEDKQFGPTGKVLRGIVNPKDIGLFQINEFYHLETAQKLGIDIYTEKGNTEYALWLYEKQGMKPWLASKDCWQKKLKTV